MNRRWRAPLGAIWAISRDLTGHCEGTPECRGVGPCTNRTYICILPQPAFGKPYGVGVYKIMDIDAKFILDEHLFERIECA